MNELALFAGDGGGILGGKLLGWRTVCAVEIKPSSRRTLCARQDDGCLDPFPIWDDVRTFDGKPWRGVVDIVTGGFPCQDISVAGGGAGITGARSGLWSHMRRIIGEVRPRYVLVENSPALTTRGGVRVVGDLAALGYDCRWGIISAADAIWAAGTPCLDHLRERIWIAGTCADANGVGCDRRAGTFSEQAGRDESADTHCPCSDANSLRELQPQGCEQDQRGWIGDSGEEAPDAERLGREQVEQSINGRKNSKGLTGQAKHCGIAGGRSWWATEPDVGRVADGVASRVDRLHGLGNGQVPDVVVLAWETLTS